MSDALKLNRLLTGMQPFSERVMYISVHGTFFLQCICLPFESTRRAVQLNRWDNHRHSADARRPGWIDPIMKTIFTTQQTSLHLSYIHIHTLPYNKNNLYSSNEENSQIKRAYLDGNYVGRSAVP